MAKTILTDAYVLLNSVNLSTYVESVEIVMEHEDKDITGMGATSRNHAAGLRDDTITLNMFQDMAAAAVEATLGPLLGVQAGFPVEIRGTSAAVSTTNPKWTGTMILLKHSPLSGTVGDPSMTEVELKCAAGSSITKATA